jgi:hypothetical protein
MSPYLPFDTEHDEMLQIYYHGLWLSDIYERRHCRLLQGQEEDDPTRSR